jgi:predicted anti-sigma-YlaC factor YlaD
MRCDDCRESISAQLDGEPLPSGATELDIARHLETCLPCSRFAAQTAVLHREVRVRPAEQVPDLTNAILGSLPEGARPRPVREWARYALLAVALTQLVLALPALVFGTDPGATVHVARDLGSFDVALAVGLLWAAWQPRRASGLLPTAFALAGAIALSTMVDLIRGDAGPAAEAHHLLDLAGVVLLYALSRPPAAMPSRPSRSAPIPV